MRVRHYVFRPDQRTEVRNSKLISVNTELQC